MTETSDTPDWRRREASITATLEALAGGLVVGSVTVAPESVDNASGQIWLRADCSTCEATWMSKATTAMHMHLLVSDLVRYGCAPRGHDQTGDIELIGGTSMALGSMSVEQLLEVEAECRERLEDVRTDLEIVMDIREGRFLHEDAQ